MLRYRKNHDSLLWEMKCQLLFETIEELKRFVAEQETRDARFIGETKRVFRACDVELRNSIDRIAGWKNFKNVLIDGKIIGYCGE